MRPLFRLINISATLLFATLTAHGQVPPMQWQKCYGGSEQDNAGSLRQLPDGSYIISGRTTSSDGNVTLNKGTDDAWLVKTGATGALSWQKTYGGNAYEHAECVIPTFDGGYIYTGYASSVDGDVSGLHGANTVTDVWVVKTNSTGTILWQKCLGGTGNESGSFIQQTVDSGFIVCGYAYSNDGDVSGHRGNGDAWLCRLDKAGNITWTKTFGGTEGDNVTSVRQTSDGGFIFTGATNSIDGDLTGIRSSDESRDVWIVKLNMAGAITWQKCYGGSDVQEGQQIIQNADGSYMVLAITRSTDGDITKAYGGIDCWVLKLSATGSLVWQKSYGGSDDDYVYDIIAGQNGGYIFCGSTKSRDGDVTANKGFYDVWVVKLDNAGNIAWQQTYGGLYGDVGKSVIRTLDGGYAVLGTTASIDGDVAGLHGKNDIWVIKLGQEPTDVETTRLQDRMTAYPTSTDRYTTLKLDGNGSRSISDIRVLNIHGALVARYQPNAHTYQLDFDGTVPGTYLLQVTFSDRTTEAVRVVYTK